MTPRLCEKCKTLFYARMGALKDMLCRGCRKECELIYHTLKDFLEKHPSQYYLSDKEEIARLLNIPVVFITLLAAEGYLAEVLIGANSRAERHCRRCRTELRGMQRDLCPACSERMQGQLIARQAS